MRIAEFCEVAGRDFIYTKGLTKGKEGTSTGICCLDDRLTFACACKHSSNCTFRCKVGSPALFLYCYVCAIPLAHHVLSCTLVDVLRMFAQI